MNIEEIKDLIKFLSSSNLDEINIETAELKLSIKKTPRTGTTLYRGDQTGAQALPTHEDRKMIPLEQTPEDTSKSRVIKIKSPMVGTFYSSQNPDSPPFVKIGDKITKGQKLCIIEAMKLFNEIESEVNGMVVNVLLDNASPVEYAQELFWVKPIDDIET